MRIKESNKNYFLILRHALLNDCRLIWQWRNHLEARRWSFDSKKIPYLKHCLWFKEKIEDPHATIYVASNRKEQKIGQARFEQKGKKAIISVSLNPEFYGKGWGQRLIKKASKRYLKEIPQVHKIIAEISENHTASQKAFIKAGYVFKRRMIKGNQQAHLYEFKRMEVLMKGDYDHKK